MVPVIDPIAIFDSAKCIVDAERMAKKAQKEADETLAQESIKPLRYAFEQLLASRTIYVKGSYSAAVQVCFAAPGRWSPYSSDEAKTHFHLCRGNNVQWDHILGFEAKVRRAASGDYLRDVAGKQLVSYDLLGMKSSGYSEQIGVIISFSCWVTAFQHGIKMIAERTVDGPAA